MSNTTLPDWAKGLQNRQTFRPFDFQRWFEDHPKMGLTDFAEACGMTDMGVRRAIIRGTLHYKKTTLKMKDHYPEIEEYFD